MLLFPPLYVCLLLLLGLKHISFRVMLPTHYWIKCVTHNSVFCASHLLPNLIINKVSKGILVLPSKSTTQGLQHKCQK